MYSPPASGNAAPNSAQASAPASANTPPSVQTISINPGLGSCSATTPLVVKMPTPMVLPTTSMVALNKPREKCGVRSAECGVEMSPFLPSSAFRILHSALGMAPFLLNSYFPIPHSTLRTGQDTGSPLLLPLQPTLLLGRVDGPGCLL